MTDTFDPRSIYLYPKCPNCLAHVPEGQAHACRGTRAPLRVAPAPGDRALATPESLLRPGAGAAERDEWRERGERLGARMAEMVAEMHERAGVALTSKARLARLERIAAAADALVTNAPRLADSELRYSAEWLALAETVAVDREG